MSPSRRRVPFSPRLMVLLLSLGPAMSAGGIAMVSDNPDAWPLLAVGGVLTVLGVAYAWATRPHSYERWTRAWLAGQWKWGRGEDGSAGTPRTARTAPRPRSARSTATRPKAAMRRRKR
ncbi:hypothetical protein [Dactylosporangium sp. NPDC048998]|uniref:hypothetical protein n=1 Tax=Dactylosporangium sp. NPDC048998 TaxID=3363976 RepID=UPI00371E110C